MNTAELTAVHTETLSQIALSRTLANISRRAATLFQDGYTADKFADGLYHVNGPEGQVYMVTCDDVMGHDCTCQAFTKYNTCKHLQAVDACVNDLQAAAHDAQESDRDAYYFDDERWSKYDYRN